MRFSRTKDAEEKGVAIIYQELNSITELTVAENIFLDRQFLTPIGTIDWSRTFKEAEKILDRLNIKEVKPTDKVKDLTVGKQQMIEIAKALSLNARIIVFDEPTSALTDKEISSLFEIICKLKKDGVCMIYISHKMEEIEQIADRIAILRDGKTIGDVTPVKEISLDKIISRMVGRDIKDMFPKEHFTKGEITLEVNNFYVDHPLIPGEKKVKNVSFKARKGEILGISGLMGSGRTELVSGIFGAFSHHSQGEVILDGKKLSIKSPIDAINAGIGLVSEDRKSYGLILGQSIKDNATISSLDEFSNIAGIMNLEKERKIVNDYVEKLSIKTPGIDVKIDSLSGGNQQKVILAKWLNTKPKVLILDEPTRGIDVGAKVEIYKLMNKLVHDGVTVIMISSELPEILGMSDRILVLCEGVLVADIDRKDAVKEKIMEYATGNFKDKEIR